MSGKEITRRRKEEREEAIYLRTKGMAEVEIVNP
jgi:hypothetical protein